MPRPAAYTRQANFTAYASQNPATPYHPANLDLELNTIVTALTQTQTVLNGITRTDGKLLNQSVDVDQLSSKLYVMFMALRTSTTQKIGGWVSGDTYVLGDVVSASTGTFMCIVDHVASSLFATDYAAGKWILIATELGVANGAALLDTNGKVSLDQLYAAVADGIATLDNAGLLPVAQLPQIPSSKLPAALASIDGTFQATVDFTVYGMVNSMTFSVANAEALTTSKFIATCQSKVGDTLGDELELDPVTVSAMCVANGTVLLTVAGINNIPLYGQYKINYQILN